MKQKKQLNKRTVVIGVIALVVIIMAVYSFFNRPLNDGIIVVFESDASTEYEQSVIERYDADDVFRDLPHYYRLTFLHKSEQEVLKLVNMLYDEEYVLEASYIRVGVSALDYPK